jgi:hypothetical protein
MFGWKLDEIWSSIFFKDEVVSSLLGRVDVATQIFVWYDCSSE